jgi:hypothetical protein
MDVKERTRRLWEVLVEAASRERTLSYTEAAEMVGYRGPRALGAGRNGVLSRIYDYCKREGLPLLCAIVVYKDGRPNEQYRYWPVERDAVFAYDWSSIPTPPAEAFGRSG